MYYAAKEKHLGSLKGTTKMKGELTGLSRVDSVSLNPIEELEISARPADQASHNS
jgi:hypothetical protein